MSSLGLGVLSWKAPETLRVTLESHHAAGMNALFDERVVLLQESDLESQAVVANHGARAENLSDNRGILGGFDALGQAMTSDIVLITENDFPLVESGEEAKAQITRARQLIEDGTADIVLLRSRDTPGSPFDIGDKYPRYFPQDNASAAEHLKARLRRLLRPGKARRLQARATCLSHDAPVIAPFATKDLGDRFHLTSSRYLPWTNNPFMIRRDFFTDTIIATANATDTRRRTNGFKNLEVELNSQWWREQAFKIVHAPGLFTHGRVGYRGY